MLKIGSFARLRRIRFLKHLGCTLAQARDLLEAPALSPEARRQLEVVRERLSLRLARDGQRLRQLNSLLRPLMRQRSEVAEVTERALPAVTVVSIRDRVSALGTAAESMFERSSCKPRVLLAVLMPVLS